MLNIVLPITELEKITNEQEVIYKDYGLSDERI